MMKVHSTSRRQRPRSPSWTLALIALSLAGCGADMPSPPPSDAAGAQQAQTFIEAIKPRREGRPVIAIVARNEGTEITDFLLTHAVLQRADIAEVHAVAPRSGRVSLYPALQVEVAQDLAGFDQAHPTGADYVIVPAMSDTADSAILTWLKQQSDHGARIIGICAGGLVVGNTGLLDHRRFTTHWYYLEELLESHPSALYVPHQRYVIDSNIATTTGITASVPTMLALIEAIGGRDKAQALATEFGVSSWTPVHDSSQVSQTLQAQGAATHRVRELVAWIGTHLQENLCVEALARRVDMSPRNFARAFATETGRTPARFVEQARVTAAAQLLLRTSWTQEKNREP